jgi:hypothetical protein
MEDSRKELILVYNANSGFYNMIKDALHKSISPSTYGCNLCGLTFGTIHMRSKWKKFIDDLKIPSKFYHRDEFFEMLKTHPHKIANNNFPAVYLHKKGKLSLIITSDEINQTKTLEDLMDLVEKKISER